MPGSWEILEARRNRVCMAVISRAGYKVSKRWADAYRQLDLPDQSQIVEAQGGPYDASRNAAAKACVDGGFGYLFFLDTDTIPNSDTVMKLIATGRDLIGATYRRRHPPFDIIGATAMLDAKGQIIGVPIKNDRPGEIVPVDFLPTGATLISRRCLEAMFAVFPRPYMWGIDVAPVSDGAGGSLPQVSEDYVFSLRAKTIGYQPWLHTGLWCKHEIDGVFGGPNGPEYGS